MIQFRPLQPRPEASWNLKPLFGRVLLGWALMLAACAGQETRKNIYSEHDPAKPLVDSKYSLTADRAKVDELRTMVPAEKKKENDELALILQLTGEVKKSPADVRSEFDKVVRKKRELIDKDLKKEREDFTNKEKRERDEFLDSQTKARDKFNAEKHSREERAERYRDLDAKRQEHFANERERRNDFESDMRDKRKNFDDYIREKNNEFNQEYRAYTRRYDDMKKDEREKKALKQKEEFSKLGSSPSSAAQGNHVEPFMSSEQADLDREVEEARRKSGSSLTPGE